MGLIKAIAGAAGGVMADQWKEYFYCEAMPANILATKGHKKVTGRSSNYKGDENIITNGSMIAVADGQCMLIVEQGKVVEVCAEPGEFLYDSSTEPSIFSGKLGDSIGKVFSNIGKRFTFGGEAPKDQRVYYFNTKELVGNKYGTASPVPFRVVDQRAAIDIDVGIRCFGEYSYENSGYGCGEWKEGVSLTLLLRGTENGAYTLSETDWCVYAFLDEARGSAQELSDAVYNAVKPYMVERAWNGEDMNMSATALSQAVNAMAKSVENYIRENASPDVTGGADAPDETETSPPEVTELPEPDTSSMRYIFDLAGYLSSDSRTKLEARAEEISTRHSCGVYVAFVDDYKVYSQGGDVYEGTYRFYHDKQLGMGDGRDGVIVLLSMQNRKYAMFIYGENAAYAINEYGAEQLEGRFLGQFSDGNWYIGAAEYLTACDEYLSLAEAGKPVRESPWAVIAIVVIVSCLIASGVCKVLKMNMKTVRRGAAADEYVTGEGLALTESSDRFMYTTETRTKIKSDSSDGGGGGSTSSCSGGGGHGRSGSF